MNSRLKTFLAYYRPYRWLLMGDLLSAIFIAGVALLLPLCARAVTKLIIDTPTPAILGQIVWIGGIMLVLILVELICAIFLDYRGHMMGALMERDMRRDLFDHLQTLDYRFYDQQQTGQLMTRITSDLLAISELCHHGPEDLIIGVLKFTGTFGILAFIDLRLTALLALIFPFMVAFAVYFKRREHRAHRISRRWIGDINAQVEDTLNGIRVVQSFTNEAIERHKFGVANAGFVESRRVVHKSEAIFYEGMGAFSQLLLMIVIVVGGIAVVEGAVDLADLTVYLLYIGLLLEPIQRFMNIARLLQEGVTGFERFVDIMRIPPAITDAPDAQELHASAGQIEFRNVSFRYAAAHGTVLRQLSLTIAPGEYVAIVGPSGVGKSTLCALIPRFYEIESGMILIDNQPIRDVTLASLRRQIGVVQQDIYLFAGSVEENIRYGRPDATHAEIVAAARQASAHDFIMALPQGYATDIGQRGVRLSGGQKQRLSIARVFLKDPPILILDEATSALDNASERSVQESLERLSRTRTTIVIAHRLSTVRNAQRILVLSPDGISEQGTHEELIERDGAYASLYAMQLEV